MTETPDDRLNGDAALGGAGADPELVDVALDEGREAVTGLRDWATGDGEDPTEVLRAVHSFKGVAASMGWEAVAGAAHRAEDLLRAGDAAGVRDALVAVADELAGLIDDIRSGRTEGDPADGDPGPTGPPTPPGEGPGQGEPGIPLGRQLVAEGLVTEDDLARAVARQRAGDPRPLGELLVDGGAISAERLAEVLDRRRRRQRDLGLTETLRVSVDTVDRLLDRVAELIILRGELVAGGRPEAEVRRLDRAVEDLRDISLTMRMQSIRHLWSAANVLVAEAARATGKQIRLITEGGETELDRSVLERLRDPLTHLLRNAVDHGIEPPGERSAAGKPTVGTVRLRAWHEAGQVFVEVSDDGRGIDPRRLREVARERNLPVGDDDRSGLELLFLPGFTTTAEPTMLSGRGVGLDVVKRNLEALSGSIEVTSTPGRGTRFTLRLPLTLAILRGLVVTVDGSRFVLPLPAVDEVVRPAADELVVVAGDRLLARSGRHLPVVDLVGILGGPAAPERELAVIVHGGRAALAVDAIDELTDVVAQATDPLLRSLGWCAGTAVLGAGSVAPIVDVAEVLRRAGVPEGARRDPPVEHRAGPEGREVLVMTVGGVRVAMPVGSVDAVIEAGGRLVDLGGTVLCDLDGSLVRVRGRPHRGGTLVVVRTGAGPAVVATESVEGLATGEVTPLGTPVPGPVPGLTVTGAVEVGVGPVPLVEPGPPPRSGDLPSGAGTAAVATGGGRRTGAVAP